MTVHSGAIGNTFAANGFAIGSKDVRVATAKRDEPFPTIEQVKHVIATMSKGLKREHWTTAAPIRAIFREAFIKAGLPYFNPHSLRATPVHLGETACQSPEAFKSWSQNLGHENVLTTFTSYGAVATRRQGELLRALAKSPQPTSPTVEECVRAVVRELGLAAPLKDKTTDSPENLPPSKA